jgi:hypothetical protein
MADFPAGALAAIWNSKNAWTRSVFPSKPHLLHVSCSDRSYVDRSYADRSCATPLPAFQFPAPLGFKVSRPWHDAHAFGVGL